MMLGFRRGISPASTSRLFVGRERGTVPRRLLSGTSGAHGRQKGRGRTAALIALLPVPLFCAAYETSPDVRVWTEKQVPGFRERAAQVSPSARREVENPDLIRASSRSDEPRLLSDMGTYIRSASRGDAAASNGSNAIGPHTTGSAATREVESLRRSWESGPTTQERLLTRDEDDLQTQEDTTIRSGSSTGTGAALIDGPEAAPEAASKTALETARSSDQSQEPRESASRFAPDVSSDPEAQQSSATSNGGAEDSDGRRGKSKGGAHEAERGGSPQGHGGERRRPPSSPGPQRIEGGDSHDARTSTKHPTRTTEGWEAQTTDASAGRNLASDDTVSVSPVTWLREKAEELRAKVFGGGDGPERGAAMEANGLKGHTEEPAGRSREERAATPARGPDGRHADKPSGDSQLSNQLRHGDRDGRLTGAATQDGQQALLRREQHHVEGKGDRQPGPATQDQLSDSVRRLKDAEDVLAGLEETVSKLRFELQSRTKWEAVRLEELLRATELEERKKLASAAKKQRAELEKNLQEKRRKVTEEVNRETELEIQRQLAEGTEKLLSLLREEFDASLAKHSAERTKAWIARWRSMQEEDAGLRVHHKQQREERLESLRKRAKSLASSAEELDTLNLSSRQAGALLEASLAILALAGDGKPFKDRISAFNGNMQLAEPLQPYAEQGIPTLLQLQRLFPTVEKDGRTAAMIPPEQELSAMAWMLATICSKLKVRATFLLPFPPPPLFAVFQPQSSARADDAAPWTGVCARDRT